MRFVVLGGGPAGVQAASYAARLGAKVTVVEKDVLGGAANLWDCIPSKAMIATGGLVSLSVRAAKMGVNDVKVSLDLDEIRARIAGITQHLERSNAELLRSQGVEVVEGEARFLDPHRIAVRGRDGHDVEIEGDAFLISTGSRPRVPDWATVDGKRVLTTRQAYPPPEIPEHLVVIGSGVTGVEFVHMFRTFGSQVSLIVSRQQVLPQKDPEVAAALEADFLDSGVRLYKGARAKAVRADEEGVVVDCDDGRSVAGSHCLLAVGSIPNYEGLNLEMAGVEVDDGGFIPVDHHCVSNVKHIYAAGDISGKLPLASVATMQGRKVAEHVMGLDSREHRHLDYDKAASAIFTEPEIADVGLAEAEAFSMGRKIRVTKVPFAANARALINGDPRGFIKILSDPATGVVLGGSIVGERAAELISVIALAVTAHLKVSDIVESLLVHPALAEALAEAAD
ncbi:dihydrolipoamide dehydrogenase [Ferrithrix thermotolerans DSM 19514]|uniref:Dihydrolipoamide dehydrogenase n=1 Tax=Ferrithrix thermotolerans DSM 19514 TaxID=1121881 RepID=A0A1M4V6G2_9ACTN|nr:FAD-dependent oxidoreductase [Ferrithrix thermotolerans]SHE64571.1 dihydrolipoamide dehydrogenase [Ferrithrix thermotolerans DSM 19514]